MQQDPMKSRQRMRDMLGELMLTQHAMGDQIEMRDVRIAQLEARVAELEAKLGAPAETVAQAG